MRIEPLALPEAVTGIQKFLLGVPLVGPGARAYRSLKRKLKERTAECLDAWEDDPATLRVRDRVSAIIQEYFFWPNRYYLPDDRCDALFYDPTVDMRGVEALAVLDDTFCLPADFLDGLYEWTYGELIGRLVSLQGAAESE